MRYLSLAALTAGLAAMAVTSAGAADLPVKAPRYSAPIVAPLSWTGCYIGGHAGGAWSRDSFTFINNTGVVEDFSFDPSSFIGGAQVGCQYQFAPNWVLGIEARWSGVDLSQGKTSVIIPPRVRGIDMTDIATVAGRLGYTWGAWMLYGTAGWADVKVNTTSINPLTGVTGDTHGWNGGAIVGAGLEFQPWQNLVLGVEFDYVHVTFDRSGAFSDGEVPLLVTNGSAGIYTVMGH